MASLELEHLPSPSWCWRPNHRVRPAGPFNTVIVTEDLTSKVVAWATEIARYAAQLPSRQPRDDYLRERRRELVAGAQAEGATPHRLMPRLWPTPASIGAPNYDRAVSAAGRGTAGACLASRNLIRPTWASVERNLSSRQAISALFNVGH